MQSNGDACHFSFCGKRKVTKRKTIHGKQWAAERNCFILFVRRQTKLYKKQIKRKHYATNIKKV